jgi:hypothetical protein
LVAFHYIQDLSLFLGAAAAVNLERSNVDIEFFVEDSFEDFAAAGLKVNGIKDPVLWLVAYAKTALILVAFDYEIIVAYVHHMTSLNPHPIAGVCVDLRLWDNAPVRHFPDTCFKSILFIHDVYVCCGQTG